MTKYWYVPLLIISIGLNVYLLKQPKLYKDNKTETKKAVIETQKKVDSKYKITGATKAAVSEDGKVEFFGNDLKIDLVTKLNEKEKETSEIKLKENKEYNFSSVSAGLLVLSSLPLSPSLGGSLTFSSRDFSIMIGYIPSQQYLLINYSKTLITF